MHVRTHLVLAGFAALVLAACGDGQTTPPSADASAATGSSATPRTAYAVSISGSALLLVDGALVDLEPGSPITDQSRITVGPESHIDLQFAETALVKVDGPAEFIVRTQLGPLELPAMRIELIVGAVTARVAELSGSDSFTIRSGSALYSVRGTEFHVDTTQSESVSVAEGEVAVLPRPLDLVTLRQYLSADDPLHQQLTELDRAAPFFTSGQHGEIEPVPLQRANDLAAALAELIVNSDRTREAGDSLVAELREAIRATREVLSSVAASGSPVPAETAGKLAAIAQAPLLPVPKDPQNRSLLEGDSAAELVKFTLRTLPQNAEIYIDGAFVGSSVYRAVLRANQSLSIRVAKAGYRERRIQVDRARSEVLTVQLERLPPSISAESFLQAIAADDLGTIRTYVQEGGSVDVRTAAGIPALVLASGIVPVLQGQAPDLTYDRDILRTIVAAGANLETPFVVEGSTFKLLHAAVLAGVAGFDVRFLVQTLISSGVRLNATIVLEGEELTPLAIAVRWALFTGETQEDLIKDLVASGASLDVTISYNDELLSLREIAARLIEQGSVQDTELLDLLKDAGVAS